MVANGTQTLLRDGRVTDVPLFQGRTATRQRSDLLVADLCATYIRLLQQWTVE
jgi:hypothetical protein